MEGERPHLFDAGEEREKRFIVGQTCSNPGLRDRFVRHLGAASGAACCLIPTIPFHDLLNGVNDPDELDGDVDLLVVPFEWDSDGALMWPPTLNSAIAVEFKVIRCDLEAKLEPYAREKHQTACAQARKLLKLGFDHVAVVLGVVIKPGSAPQWNPYMLSAARAGDATHELTRIIGPDVSSEFGLLVWPVGAVPDKEEEFAGTSTTFKLKDVTSNPLLHETQVQARRARVIDRIRKRLAHIAEPTLNISWK